MAAGPVLFIIVAVLAAKPRRVAAEPVHFIIVAAVAAESVAVGAESVAAVAVALLSEIRPYDRRLYCPSRFAQASGEWRVCY